LITITKPEYDWILPHMMIKKNNHKINGRRRTRRSDL